MGASSSGSPGLDLGSCESPAIFGVVVLNFRDFSCKTSGPETLIILFYYVSSFVRIFQRMGKQTESSEVITFH